MSEENVPRLKVIKTRPSHNPFLQSKVDSPVRAGSRTLVQIELTKSVTVDRYGHRFPCVDLTYTDTITILSPTVCVILCELNLADDIYKTMAQNNRSVPWMKVCVRACSILINLTKYTYTRKYVLKKEYALALVKLLGGSLKDKVVFLHCATLIWLLSQDEDYSKAVATCPQINWLIKNIQQKVLKDDAVAKLQKFKDLEKLYPNCGPDRNNAQKPRLFTDMSFAVAAIVKRIYT